MPLRLKVNVISMYVPVCRSPVSPRSSSEYAVPDDESRGTGSWLSGPSMTTEAAAGDVTWVSTSSSPPWLTRVMLTGASVPWESTVPTRGPATARLRTAMAPTETLVESAAALDW